MNQDSFQKYTKRGQKQIVLPFLGHGWRKTRVYFYFKKMRLFLEKKKPIMIKRYICEYLQPPNAFNSDLKGQS